MNHGADYNNCQRQDRRLLRNGANAISGLLTRGPRVSLEA